VRLYGLRMWVEQSYKQVKYALGWRDYQVRSDRAMRRHWALVGCAFSFCWLYADGEPGEAPLASDAPEPQREPPLPPAPPPSSKKKTAQRPRPHRSWPAALRAVRAWLEPWSRLWRYWRGWSSLPPPPLLAALLDQLAQGHGINVYACP
jgi:hypothetical protein